MNQFARRSVAAFAVLVVVVTLLTSGVAVAQDDDRDADDRDADERDEQRGENLGWPVLVLLGLTVSYVPYKRFRSPAPSWLGRRRMLRIHKWSGAGATGIAAVHGLVVEDGNLLLWLAVVLMAFASVNGFLLGTDVLSSTQKRRLYQIHTQRLFVVAIVLSAAVGHLLVMANG